MKPSQIKCIRQDMTAIGTTLRHEKDLCSILCLYAPQGTMSSKPKLQNSTESRAQDKCVVQGSLKTEKDSKLSKKVKLCKEIITSTTEPNKEDLPLTQITSNIGTFVDKHDFPSMDVPVLKKKTKGDAEQTLLRVFSKHNNSSNDNDLKLGNGTNSRHELHIDRDVAVTTCGSIKIGGDHREHTDQINTSHIGNGELHGGHDSNLTSCHPNDAAVNISAMGHNGSGKTSLPQSLETTSASSLKTIFEPDGKASRIFSSSDNENSVIRLCMPADSISAFAHGIHLLEPPLDYDKKSAQVADEDSNDEDQKENNETVSSENDRLTGKTTGNLEHILVSDLAAACNISKLRKFVDQTTSLLFTRKEQAILLLGPQNNVPDDVHAGIIWHAVEREQFPVFQDYDESDSSFQCSPPKLPPASAHAILELLLGTQKPQPEIIIKTKKKCTKTDGMPSSRFFHFASDDLALISCIDVVLSHYAVSSQRINPFNSWSGAGEKGLLVKECRASDGKIEWWKRYYLDHIMGGKAPSNGGLSSGSNNNGKMKRGHKIASCLLRWAKHMQLQCDTVDGIVSEPTAEKKGFENMNGYSCRQKILWDHESFGTNGNGKETGECQLPVHINFVAEIMRLLAARFREGREERRRNIKRGKTKPRTVSTRSSKLHQPRGSQDDSRDTGGARHSPKKRKR